MESVLDYNTEIYFRVQKDRIMNVIKKRPRCHHCTTSDTLQKLCQMKVVLQTDDLKETFSTITCLDPFRMVSLVGTYSERVMNRYEYSNENEVFEKLIFYLKIVCDNIQHYDVSGISIILHYSIHDGEEGSTIYIENCVFLFYPRSV